MIDEAVSLIREHFKDGQASVFLGTLQGRSLATDLALLQAGKSFSLAHFIHLHRRVDSTARRAYRGRANSTER